jgi:G3E family GTPase
VSSASDTPGALSEELLELPNGCLCCSIKDMGLAAIEKMMERKGAFDYILLETTGLADPGGNAPFDPFLVAQCLRLGLCY